MISAPMIFFSSVEKPWSHSRAGSLPLAFRKNRTFRGRGAAMRILNQKRFTLSSRPSTLGEHDALILSHRPGAVSHVGSAELPPPVFRQTFDLLPGSAKSRPVTTASDGPHHRHLYFLRCLPRNDRRLHRPARSTGFSRCPRVPSSSSLKTENSQTSFHRPLGTFSKIPLAPPSRFFNLLTIRTRSHASRSSVLRSDLKALSGTPAKREFLAVTTVVR